MEPDFVTFRDLVEVVERVEDKLDEHKLVSERRFGRIEKGMVLVAALALFHPSLPAKSVPFLEGAIHTVNALSLIH